MEILEYKKKPVKLIVLGLFVLLTGCLLTALWILDSPYLAYFPPSISLPFSSWLPFVDSVNTALLVFLVPGLLCLMLGVYLLFSTRKVLIDRHNKMVFTQISWFAGLIELSIHEFPFHSFRAIAIGGKTGSKKDSCFYPLLLGMENMVIPCGSKNQKTVILEIKKISKLMQVNIEKKYKKLPKSMFFKA